DNYRGKESRDSAKQNPATQPRFAEPHRLVHSVNRKRRKHVPSAEASIAHALCGFVKRGGARILRCHRVNFVTVRGGYHRVLSFPWGDTAAASLREARHSDVCNAPLTRLTETRLQLWHRHPITCAPFPPAKSIRVPGAPRNADPPQAWPSSLPTSRSSGGNG